ncbi:hypothetical protein AXF42_Ash016609 [Apostasia shenzhenica]|uniref:IBH1-like N-terminal domain-containing protein n=1 Tax=Apostasia shenzhenica TaxID=1088818 RepID=A0A2I0A1K0_9ASPA|nr:hypothetical protein AXF42_Ash016609 [Apostasia shenzhenica]
MQASDTFKQIFIKNMLMGLKLGTLSKNMSFLKRKRAIKLSADIAMAVARGCTNWSSALIACHNKHAQDKVFISKLLGRKKYESITKLSFTRNYPMPTKTLWRSQGISSRLRGRTHASKGASARKMAKSLIKKRKEILKCLIPGGKSLDELSLLGETIDYIVSLEAQVNLMRQLAQVLGVSKQRYF